jgi:hypothetical protein
LINFERKTNANIFTDAIVCASFTYMMPRLLYRQFEQSNAVVTVCAAVSLAHFMLEQKLGINLTAPVDRNVAAEGVTLQVTYPRQITSYVIQHFLGTGLSYGLVAAGVVSYLTANADAIDKTRQQKKDLAGKLLAVGLGIPAAAGAAVGFGILPPLGDLLLKPLIDKYLETLRSIL